MEMAMLRRLTKYDERMRQNNSGVWLYVTELMKAQKLFVMRKEEVCELEAESKLKICIM